jgi:hypothetical protein
VSHGSRLTTYSTRSPEIAREMTSRWISDVPSKIVQFSIPGPVASARVACVPPEHVVRVAASTGVRAFRRVVGMKVGMMNAIFEGSSGQGDSPLE